MLDLLKPLVGPALEAILDRIPDPNAKEKARQEYLDTVTRQVSEMNAAQSRVNEIEAQHPSIWVSGWRPAIGWTCAVSLAWHYVGMPILSSLISMAGGRVDLPVLPVDSLYQLVLALLGMGGLRTFEKIRGVERKR